MSDDKPSTEYVLTTLYSGGFVKKPETAQKIVEAVIAEMTGEKNAEQEGPFQVTDQGDRWVVQSSRRESGRP